MEIAKGKSQFENTTCSMSPIIWYSETDEINRDMKKDGWICEATGQFLGYWNYLYDMVIVDTQKSGHMTLLKPTKIYSTEWTFF